MYTTANYAFILWNLGLNYLDLILDFAGPNSPLPWVQACIKLLLSGIPEGDLVKMHEASSKILVGLNFYGMDYTATGGRPILGRELQKHISEAENQLEDVQAHFSEEAVEHFFSFRSAILPF